MLLWSWGANSHGQLGLGVNNEQIETPTKVEADLINGINKISCGGGHTLLLDGEGKLYACGWNSKLQLGTDQYSNNFQRVWPLSGVKFINIACGWDFSCGVTDDQFLFVWGSNSHGQLGLPKEHFSENVKPIKLQVNACAIAMGLRHSVIINSKGEVWSTGCGKHGQLGLGKDVLASDRFQKVSNTGKISHIACGQNHTVAWCSDEKAIYVWGDNKHGQLFLDTEKYKKIFIPQKIDICVKQNVTKLLSGWTNILLWLEDGSILTCGRNNYGQLGTNNQNHPRNFVHVNLPDGRLVKDISVGSEHTVCLATDNTLWAWGWNEHANTGTTGEPCVMLPTLVPIQLQVNEVITHIYSGSAHNFVVTENSQKCDIKLKLVVKM